MLRVLALLLALCGAAHSEESSPRESENKAETAHSNDQHGSAPKQITVPANSSPTIINIQTSKHSDSERECAKPKDWKEWAAFVWCKSDNWLDAERTIAVFTVILAISTTMLWWATRKLYLAGERQMELIEASAAAQSRDMQASIAEAKKSADAAMLAVGSDRAWMTFDEPMIVPVNNANIDGVWHDNGFMFAAWWKNMGRSPATNAEIASDHCLVPIDTKEPPSFTPYWYKEPGVGSTVGSNARVRSLPRAVGTEDRQLIENGSVAIILFAEIRYRDIFNPGILHTSTVCLRIEFNGLITDARTGAQQPRWEIIAVGPQNRIT